MRDLRLNDAPTTKRPAPATPPPKASALRDGLPNVRVILHFRAAHYLRVDEEEVDWPPDWRIPQAGDAVHLRDDYGGLVQYADFDLGRGVIVIHLK